MNCDKFDTCIRALESTRNKYQRCSSEECLMSLDSRSIAVFEENKKKYRLRNPEPDLLARYQVDGAMLQDQDNIKCDNLVIDLDKKIAIFVELKGTDLRHALAQIDSTVNRLCGGLKGYRMYSRIVTSSRTNVPNIKTYPPYVQLQKKMMRYQGNLDSNATILEDDLTKM